MNLNFSYPDLSDPKTYRQAAGNFIHSLETAPAGAVETGSAWYPKVHEAVQKSLGRRGFLSGQSDKMLAGAGLVAAVSPNMDWDKSNIDALLEMHSLKSGHWDAIMHGSRADAASAVAGTSLSSAPRGNLQKAGRIIRGENPESVIGRGAPKTHAFMHNIADPSNPHHVTIDGRAFDTMTNRLRPWGAGRGISTGTTGGRYDLASSVVQEVAHGAGLDPSAAQAISWTHTKYHMEQSGVTQRGAPRKQGPARRGQPYFHPVTGEPALHMSGGQFNGV